MPENTQEPRRPGLTPAIARVRLAVRESFDALTEAIAAGADTRFGPAPDAHGIPGANGTGLAPLILVALSGGPDSLALAAATAFEAPARGWRAGAIIVDHGLQEGSAAIAERAAEQARALGMHPVHISRVTVGTEGGPENAAREARRTAIESYAAEVYAFAVLLGHTLDDQAETVLLGLSRGSGAGSLQGMAPRSGGYVRPLLGVRREDTHAACVDAELSPWQDPHNEDPSFTRVRVRREVLPVLERELGPGIAQALARTAEQSREDAEAFSEMIEEFIEEICQIAEAGIAVEVGALAANPAALRNRIIRLVAESEFGVSLSRTHTLEIAALVTHWHGQGPIDVPRIRVHRDGPLLVFTARN